MQRHIKFSKKVLSQSPMARRIDNRFTFKTPIDDSDRATLAEIGASIAKERGKPRAADVCAQRAFYANIKLRDYRKAARFARNHGMLIELDIALELYVEDFLEKDSKDRFSLQRLIQASEFVLSHSLLFSDKKSVITNFLAYAKKINLPIIENIIAQGREPNPTFLEFLMVGQAELKTIRSKAAEKLREDGKYLRALMVEYDLSRPEVEILLRSELRPQDSPPLWYQG